ncbi:MAG TPA: anthranilate synthase component I family protein [Pirellulaceae bacterium]|nr:anthranilate synthase component I family protein [Pirellulaceae bacterium]
MTATLDAAQLVLAARDTGLPLVCELRPAPDPEAAFVRLARQRHCLFLDSALREPSLGRYSFLAADPFATWECAPESADGLARLRSELDRWRATTIPGLPPFQGGAAGLLSYDLSRSLERIPRPRHDEFQIPGLAIGLYDTVLTFDHAEHRAWIISQGFPETNPDLRRRRAQQRIEQFSAWISEPSDVDFTSGKGLLANDRLDVEDLAPQFATGVLPELTSNFSPDDYRATVQRAIDYIYAGDVFQVNIAQRLLHRACDDSASLYLRLRHRNPATFAGFLDWGRFQIASASPERFVRVLGGEAEARPIKGTRRRTRRPEADLFAGDELLASEKDRAENVMIVDLLRNDLSRVCQPGSVRVAQLCGLETYQFVQHLVSVVVGQLRPGLTAIDLIPAAFPGGSITGAPKVRAMEIIAELEPTARGAYCGSLGYFGFDGAMDLSILIRTITACRGWWQLPVGGGIVAQSNPQDEFLETWHKAAGLLAAVSER